MHAYSWEPQVERWSRGCLPVAALDVCQQTLDLQGASLISAAFVKAVSNERLIVCDMMPGLLGAVSKEDKDKCCRTDVRYATTRVVISIRALVSLDRRAAKCRVTWLSRNEGRRLELRRA